MPREWDAVAYDRLGSPMTRWGETVVGWLDLNGDERVLDAGCGTGRVTERLLERLPRGRVIALDGSILSTRSCRPRRSIGSWITTVAIRLPGPRIDYVRLNIRARRAG
jgi:trans-aconitate 2-methyltransferase